MTALSSLVITNRSAPEVIVSSMIVDFVEPNNESVDEETTPSPFVCWIYCRFGIKSDFYDVGACDCDKSSDNDE